jgi:ferredoxin
VSPAGSVPDNRDPAVEITILPDSERVTARPDETLLAALSRSGLGYRIGCRRGGCGVCKLHLLLGEVRYERAIADSVLSDDERIEGICLSCRAVPITNVVIELQEGDKLRRVLPLGFASGLVVKREARTLGSPVVPDQRKSVACWRQVKWDGLIVPCVCGSRGGSSYGR